MTSLGNKKSRTVKEEGEITDDDEDDGHEKGFWKYNSMLYKELSSRYFSLNRHKNLEAKKFSVKRKEYRRRADVDSRYSSRTAAESGPKKYYREHQESRQTSASENYIPSKFWANRRFRASSVQPLSPKHGKSSGLRRPDSPQKYKAAADSAADDQEELQRLEREQKRIREQLKSLEEEEESDEGVLESLDARSEAEDLSTQFSETTNNAELNYILQSEKSEDEDIDIQELRRLALATSERHIRLMAIEPPPSQSGIPCGDVVVIPDVEPDLPEPEVVMVDEDEDVSKVNNRSSQPVSAPMASPSIIKTSSAKKKNRKSKKKGHSNTNKSNVHEKNSFVLKSKISHSKKSKTKHHKKGNAKQEDEWIKHGEELRILVMDDPGKALEKLLKLATEWRGTEKPIATGTIKDIKRQKQIPVISDKRAVQNFAQQSVEKKKILLEKSKEVKNQDKKSGQQQDNYEEVEMDIDSNADDEDESAGIAENPAIIPLPSFPVLATTMSPPLPAQISTIPMIPPMPSLFINPAPLPFDIALPPPPLLPPPLPPPIPAVPLPPLPPQPPSPQEQDTLWKNQSAKLEERIAEFLKMRFIVNNTLSKNNDYTDETSVLPHHLDNQDFQSTFLPQNFDDRVNQDYKTSNINDSPFNRSYSSVDDDITRRLRMIRQNRDNSVESHVVNSSRINPVVPSRSSSNLYKFPLQHLIHLNSDTLSYGEKKSEYVEMENHLPVHDIQTNQISASDSLELYNFFTERLSSPGNEEQSEPYTVNDSPNKKEKYRDEFEITRRLPANKHISKRSVNIFSRNKFNAKLPILQGSSIKRQLRDSFREVSSSPHSPALSRSLHLNNASKHRDQLCSPPQRSASREILRDHHKTERTSADVQQRTHRLQLEHYRASTSPQQCARNQRSNSSEEAVAYLPEMPPAKKMKHSPPPYIPTTVRASNISHVPQQNHHHSSDSEEEDPAALRNKLLADVIEKRKSFIEGLSNNTTPSAVSPKQDSTYSESSETLYVADLQDEHALKQHHDTGLKNTDQILRASEVQEDDDEEDVLPPPVISRVSRLSSETSSHREVRERKVNLTEEQQLSPQTEQSSLLSVLKKGDSDLYVILEDDSNDFSSSDLEVLRNYVNRAKALNLEQVLQTEYSKNESINENRKLQSPSSIEILQHSAHLVNSVVRDSLSRQSPTLTNNQGQFQYPANIFDKDLKDDFLKQNVITGCKKVLLQPFPCQLDYEKIASPALLEFEQHSEVDQYPENGLLLSTKQSSTSTPYEYQLVLQAGSINVTQSAFLPEHTQINSPVTSTEPTSIAPLNALLNQPTSVLKVDLNMSTEQMQNTNSNCQSFTNQQYSSSGLHSTSSVPSLKDSVITQQSSSPISPVITQPCLPISVITQSSTLPISSMITPSSLPMSSMLMQPSSLPMSSMLTQPSSLPMSSMLTQPSSLPMSSVIPISTMVTQPSLETSINTGQSPQQPSNRLFDKNNVSAFGVHEDPKNVTKEPMFLSTNISGKNSIADQSTNVKSVGAIVQSQSVRQTVDSDSLSTLLSYNERQNVSSYSNQAYGSGAAAGVWKYPNIHMLPVHPKVLVPMNSSSGSEGEEDDDKERTEPTSMTFTRSDSIGMILKNQELLAQIQRNKKRATQILSLQERILSNQQLSIQKDQRSVKVLVKRAVKFLETQQKEEEKQKAFNAQLVALSHKLKTSERFVMLLKAEKEQTEKQANLVTEKILQKKTHYEKKVKAVMSLGTKLLGPNYVPKVLKPPLEATSQVKQSLTRAQEKQKLMEKEKQIAEKLKKLKEAQAEKVTGRLQAVKNISGSAVNPGSKWKSQDVIHIDNDQKLDVSVTPRRRSLLEVLGPSTTPNIPATPRRSTSMSNMEKENIASEVVEIVKTADVEASMGLSTFRMPCDTLLNNLRKLQREKALKYVKSPKSSSNTCSYPSLSGLQASSSSSVLRLQVSERQQKHSREVNKPFRNTSHAYSSPLLMFKSYRFSSYFRTKENLSLQSSTYSNKINPNSVLCPYDLQGTCSDDTCQQQHPKDYKYTDHELLEDIISYCPRLAGAKEDSSPEEVEKCIVTFVDNLLSKHKGKMSIDDLSLWLLSQVNEVSKKRRPYMVSFEQRVWRPHPKEEIGLSLDLSQQLDSRKVQAIKMDRKITDKDTVINDEDTRYFAADITELLVLETSIMEDQTNIQLWQKLASKKLYNSNKSPKECLEEALSVLSRGLEVNKNDPDLWYTYLSLYRRHSEVKDFPEFCQMALEYAPSYALWFLYLDYLKTFSEKDEVSSQALKFLYNTAKDKRKSSTHNVTISRQGQKTDNYSEQLKKNLVDSMAEFETDTISNVIQTDEEVIFKEKTLCDVCELSDENERIVLIDKNCHTRLNEADGKMDSDRESEKLGDDYCSMFDWKMLSHQMLEMVLYKTSLYLLTGKTNTALHFLQMILELKKNASFTLNVAEFLTPADHLVMWLVYIHVLEWGQLPEHIYSAANQNPGRLMAKENITLPWPSKASLNNDLDTLVKLHDKAVRIWKHSSSVDEETQVYLVKLIQSLVLLLVSQNRCSEAIERCRNILSGKHMVDIWLILADVHALCQDKEAVKNVFNEALSVDKNNSKLKFYQCLFLFQQGESEFALVNLEQFAMSHFSVIPRNPLYSEPGQLFSQLLKQQESFSLYAAQLKKDVAINIHKDIFIWLCYSLFLEIKGRTSDTVEVYERSLTLASTTDDLILVWQNYITYLMRSRTPPKKVRDRIVRSIISLPTKFPVTLSTHSSAVWVNYHHINKLVEAWLAVLSSEDTMDFMEMCLALMPNNIYLLLRAIDTCLQVKETRRAYSWCKFVAVQADRPANLVFWKIAAALAQVEGTPKEVEQMLIGCVETMPLAISSWKDLLLFEVTRENELAVQKIFKYCQQLELNIESFTTIISSST